MSALGDVLAVLRQLATLDHRVEELTKEVAEMKRREENTRERLIRLETIIDEARRAGAAQRIGRS